jgi:septum formation protein
MRYEYVLASASPRRKELLGELLSAFSVSPSDADENVEVKSPRKLVEILSKKKATEVAFRAENEGKIVIGSDTVVAFGGKVLGKPKDEEEAISMLSALSGKKHYVYTGVCFVLCDKGKVKTVTGAVKTAVYFEKLSPEWILEYVRGGSPMDKAGAYGIQDGGLVKRIKGSYSNVVGLPVEYCKKMLSKIERRGM